MTTWHLRQGAYRLYCSIWTFRMTLWVLAGLFILAGAVKLSNPHAFAVQVEQYGLLPAAWIDPVAFALPLLEVSAGLSALIGRRGGIEAIGAMLLLFIGILGYALWQGIDLPCGCFSLEDETRRHGVLLALLRDLAMLAGVSYLLAWRRRHGDLVPVHLNDGAKPPPSNTKEATR